ncbi:hypothetical protein C5E43_27390 [Nocardia cyriacigeorgica]|nr:hypothetical protein C5B73_03065 [Nocardia cyriacigeorgica]PPJ02031.1 hypothetical protein C5E43_27390 [Nocardia cyriacigeorgica]
MARPPRRAIRIEHPDPPTAVGPERHRGNPIRPTGDPVSQHSSDHPEQRDHPPIAPQEDPVEPARTAPADGIPLGRLILGRAWPYRVG